MQSNEARKKRVRGNFNIETAIEEIVSAEITPMLQRRMQYRDNLRQMSDLKVHQLVLGLTDPKYVKILRRHFNPYGHVITIGIPKTGTNDRDEYYFGVSSEEDLTSLGEEVAIRRAEPRHTSLRHRLSKVFGGYI